MLYMRVKGGEGLKVWEHDFEITCDPKGLQRGPIFWSGFEALDTGVVATPIFPPKRPQKLKLEIKCHNIDFTLAFDKKI